MRGDLRRKGGASLRSALHLERPFRLENSPEIPIPREQHAVENAKNDAKTP
jgi:hypothetical protein